MGDDFFLWQSLPRLLVSWQPWIRICSEKAFNLIGFITINNLLAFFKWFHCIFSFLLQLSFVCQPSWKYYFWSGFGRQPSCFAWHFSWHKKKNQIINRHYNMKLNWETNIRSSVQLFNNIFFSNNFAGLLYGGNYDTLFSTKWFSFFLFY